MRNVTLLVFGLLLVPTMAVAKPNAARAIHPLLRPIAFLKAQRKYNRGVDRDARLGLRDYNLLQRTGKLPRHAQPQQVLARKIARAQKTLDSLTRSANSTRYMSTGFGGVVVEFKSTFYKLNELSQQLDQASRYAKKNGLQSTEAVRSMARNAVDAMSWHSRVRFQIAGFGSDFSRTYHSAAVSYSDLKILANGLWPN